MAGQRVLFKPITLVSLIQFQLDWKLGKRPFNLNLVTGIIYHFCLDHGAIIIHGMAESGIPQTWTLMTPFESYVSKLSENQK